MRARRGLPGSAPRRAAAGLAGALPAALLALLWGACGDVPDAAAPEAPESRVAALEVVGGADQRILAGRRSPEPVRVKATDAAGEPVAGAVVVFTLEGAPALLSQPRALSDDAGAAETFLLEPRSGTTLVRAASGAGRATVELFVERAPGELVFAAASGAVGLPGHPHPDSVVRVRVLDTEARPMEGVEVWFAGHRRLSAVRDTSDAAGWASTIVRQAQLHAGEGRLYAFITGFQELTVSTTRPVEPAARRVVLVSVDGLRGDALARWDPPTLARLAAEGAFTADARTVTPSFTTPAHLSMLSGVSPDAHGIFLEQLEFTASMADLEPLFRSASREGIEARAFMAEEGPLAAFETALQCRLAFGLDSVTFAGPPAPLVSDAVAVALGDPDVRLLFAHLPDPDLAGHEHGFDSRAYGEAVLRTDSAVARIAAALGEGDLLLLTSDHGGGGAWGAYQHGSDSDADTRIPLLLWGARTRATEPEEATILDVGPTVLWALGLRVPEQYEGRILLEAFH